VASLEIDERISAVQATLANLEKVFDVPATEAEIGELETAASAPDLWDDQANAQKVTSRLSFLQGEVRRMTELTSRAADIPVHFELAEAEGDQSALDEAVAELESLEKDISDLEVRTLLSGEYDEREALVTIRSEAGGVDAADWAEMLMRMYLRYCERHGWSVEMYDTSYAEEAGIKSATLQAKLLERRRQEEQAKIDALKGDSSGSWGNQMRSYVLHPYQMVKDLRTEQETGNTQAVLDGEIDDFIASGIRWRRQQAAAS
jgi:peptide chain release factor 2